MKTFWNKLAKPFFVLAPMDDVTDTIFRRVISQAAPADVYFTEFTNATSFCSPKGKSSTDSRLAFKPEEQPIVAQIWGTNPEHYAIMSKHLAKQGFSGIDINMGCPERRIVKNGACSALIENPSLAAELIEAAKTGGLPVSVKTRLGFKTQKTEEWASFLLKQDIAALSMHGRTQKEMSKVPARWEEIGKIVKIRDELSLDTLVIGNGDVKDREHGEKIAKQYKVDGIMIGRGVFQNPFGLEKPAKSHSRDELLGLLNLHLDLFDEENKKSPRKFAPLKRFFKIYVRNFSGASELRNKLMQTNSTQEVRRLIEPLG